jgi:hypothetical protein
MYQLLVILFIVLAVLGIRHISKQPEDIRPSLRLRYGLYALLGLAILLVFSGKLHWVAGAIAAILPIIQRFFPLLVRFLPFFKNKVTETSQKKTSTPSNAMDAEMDLKRALQVFGFEALPSEEKVVQRHRELMQKNHPDRGGSDFLASQINQAKEVLVNAQKTA